MSGNSNIEVFSNNIVTGLLFIFIYNCIKKINFKFNRMNVFILTYSIILSLVIVFGTQLEYNGEIFFNLKIFFEIICVGIDSFTILQFLNAALQKYTEKRKNIKENRLKIAGFCSIFITSLLVFLAVYPGIFGYDAIYELQSGLILGRMNEHYSVIFVHLLSRIFSIGIHISGGYQLGCAIFIIMQLIFMTYVSNKICYKIYEFTKDIKL